MEFKKKASFVRITLMLLLVLVIFPLLPMIVSGRWNWWQAWVMAAVFILGFIVSRVIAARKTPDILKERANYSDHDNMQLWDKWLSPVVAFGSVLILLAAGLDALFDWSPDLSLGLELLGLALIVLGYGLGSYALIENAFFSGTVRLQPERGQTVISSGPYAWVRHPGYLGSLIANLGIPLLLDSAWAFLPVFIISVFFILRTHLEDRFLRANLPGYSEYAKKVRYRLLPGVW